ncbi:Dehydrogenase orsE [Fusarium oxysporum f. sp. albedinis]|nr:Dehydrogenase orsE [Fusarium oxysporum f. sp. albedinis]
MAMTIEIEPAGAHIVVSVLIMTIALIWSVVKCFGFGKSKQADPTPFTDSLPALGDTPLTATELSHRRNQETMKKQIACLERNRQLAFGEVCRVYARRIKIDENIHNLKEAIKKAELPRDIGRVAEMKKRIRHFWKEQEDCYGMVDDISHRMYLMLMQRLTLRRKIDRLDMQMECNRLADILYPQVPFELLDDVKEDVKK